MLELIKSELTKLAPKLVEALQPLATQSQFDELAKVVGQPLPEGLVRLYSEHNGHDPKKFVNFAFGYVFLPIEDVTKQCTDYTNVKPSPLKNADPGIRSEYTFAPQRIPIGDDKGTSLICVDLDPAEGGLLGQVIQLDYDFSVALKVADSVEHYAEIFLADLQAGLYHLNEDALAESNFWMDTDGEIDLVNHNGRYSREW